MVHNGNAAAKIIPTYSLLKLFIDSGLSRRLVSADSSASFIWFFFFWGERNTRTRAILLSPATWPTRPHCSPNHQPLSTDDDCPDHHQSFLSRASWPTWPDITEYNFYIVCSWCGLCAGVVCESSWSGPFLPLAMQSSPHTIKSSAQQHFRHSETSQDPISLLVAAILYTLYSSRLYFLGDTISSSFRLNTFEKWIQSAM